jgi:hypothetical protein
MRTRSTQDKVFYETHCQIWDQIHHEVWDKVRAETKHSVHQANRVWRQICIELVENVIKDETFRNQYRYQYYLF